MADNVAFTPGTGATGAADDIAGVYYPRVKLSLGPDGTANDAEAGAGAVDTGTMRVTLASDDPAVTALQIMDDWDESDRAKVNLIPSQAGITGGAGAVAANTPRVTLASDDPAVALLGTMDTDTGAISTNTSNIPDALAGEYETVAASQTGQTLGATGGTGDYLSHLLVIPATTSPGNVIILDNATSITVFTGGASSVSNLVPFQIPLGMYSASGAWSVTTGANVSVVAVGNFT